MSETPWSPKDPDEVKDYSYDWTSILDGDTIASSVWSVASGTGLVVDTPPSSFTDTVTTFWATSGVAGQTYYVLNRITTAGGRTYDRTRRLKCKTL